MDFARLRPAARRPRYAPYGDAQTGSFTPWSDPAEALQAFRDVRAGAMLGMHWSTFDRTDESVDLPPQELAALVGEVWAAPPAPATIQARGSMTRRGG